MSDHNLVCFVGPDDNGRRVDSIETLDASGGYSSAVKLSVGLSDFSGKFGKLIGGRDACIDANNLCREIAVHADELHPTGQFAITCKGGVKGAAFFGELYAHGTVCDVMLDDWSDQSHEPTAGVTLALNSKTGHPVTIRALKDRPTLTAGTGPYAFLFPWPWINPRLPVVGHVVGFIFETLRRWGFFRGKSNANTP